MSPLQPLVCGGFSDFSCLPWLWCFWRVQQVGYSVNCSCLVLSHRLGLGEGNGNPFQYSCLENPVDGGAWWAAVRRVAQGWTRLKRFSSSSRSRINCWPDFYHTCFISFLKHRVISALHIPMCILEIGIFSSESTMPLSHWTKLVISYPVHIQMSLII